MTPLSDHEASDQRATTLVDQRLLYGTQPNLAVILKATKSGAILTQSRFIRDSAISSYENMTWHYSLIPSYGDQGINLDALGSQTGAVHPPPQLASTSIDEWIAAIPQTGNDPFKPVDSPKEKHEDLPPTWVDGPKTITGDTSILPLKKRFGRNRKKPELDDIAELKADEEGDLTTNDICPHPTGELPLGSTEGLSLLEVPQQAIITGPGLPTQVPSTLAVSKTASYSGSPRSPLEDTSSSTPSTHSSTKQSDLLMLEELALAYPVMTPIPASNSQKVRSQASQASETSNSPSLAPAPPAWVGRNVTSVAENQKPGLLLDTDTERPGQPASYLAAAKRGINIRGRGSSRGRANTRGGRWHTGSSLSHQPLAHVESLDQAQQPSHQAVGWVVPKPAAHKAKMPKSKGATTTAGQTIKKVNDAASRQTVVNSNPSQPDDAATIQLLEQAHTLGGLLAMEVQIGRILVQTDSVRPIVKVYNAWSSIFDTTNGAKTETIFTNRLPNPYTVGFPYNLKETGGQQIFTNIPHDCNVRYQFLCSTVLGDEE